MTARIKQPLIARNKKEVADTLDISERTFGVWIQEGCPGQFRDYNMYDIIMWARRSKWATETDADVMDIDSIDDDDLKRELIKERISKLKRDNTLADFKIEERDASLIDVVIMKEFLAQVFQRIRNGVTTIEKKYGPDSCSPIRSAIEVTQREISGGIIDSNNGD